MRVVQIDRGIEALAANLLRSALPLSANLPGLRAAVFTAEAGNGDS